MSRLLDGLRLLLVGLVLALLLAALAFRLTGGRWMTVTTPSMGQSAPVGTLLLVRDDPRPQVGQFVVFHPPGRPNETYAHRLVAEHGGSFSTRGDANGAADPWTLPAQAVGGRVVARLWWVGWLLRLVPDLLIAAAVTFAAGRLVPTRHRLAVRLLAGSACVAGTIMLIRPFVRLVVLVDVAVDGQSATTVVPTGLMPVTVHALHGSTTVLKPGQIGTLHSPQAGADGRYHVSFLPHLTFWWWLIAVLGWLSPLIVALLAGARLRTIEQPARSRPDHDSARSESGLTIFQARPLTAGDRPESLRTWAKPQPVGGRHRSS